MKLFGLVALGLVAGSCGNPTGPSSIPPSAPPRPDVLTITPAIDALRIGSAETLTAVVVSGDGTRRTVVASWSSDAPEVVAVGEDGRVRGVSLGKTTIRGKFEGLSAAQRMQVVPDYEGTWSGEYRIVKCEQLGGNVNICDQGGVLPIRTGVTQNGATLSGTLNFYTDTHELLETGPVDGSIDDSGALVLTGTTSSAQAEQPGETKVSDWNTTLTDHGDHMTGHFIKNRHFKNFFGWQNSREGCELLNVTRSRP